MAKSNQRLFFARQLKIYLSPGNAYNSENIERQFTTKIFFISRQHMQSRNYGNYDTLSTTCENINNLVTETHYLIKKKPYTFCLD